MTQIKPRLNLYLRRPIVGAFSIEMVYQSLIPRLTESFDVSWIENREASRGFLPRFRDAIRAATLQADVNHVTGDVHFLTIFMFRRRSILTIHDFYGLERLRGLRRLVFYFFWYWLPVRCAAEIVVISRATEEQLHRYLRIDPKRVHFIPNPVREEFMPSERNCTSVVPRILQVGTGINKNFERNVRAISGLNCCFVVLGKLSQAQIALLNEFGINYEAHMNLTTVAVAELYQSCDVLLFTSLYEGFGMPIIEAQATGIPVITSTCWSMPEVAGGGAILVDPEDEYAISMAVREVIVNKELRKAVVELGFANVRKFDIAAIAERYIQVYNKVLNR